LAAIREAIDRDDMEQIRIAAHSLKGAADTLSAAGVVDAASALEQLGQSGTLGAAAAVWQRLERESDQLISALSAL
jgi:HPt (histidine-containing phosphotransfer) domain-containing protein